MARTTLLVVCLVACLTGHAYAKCNTTTKSQSATLKSQTPKGCLVAAMESGAFTVPVDATCLNDLIFNSTTKATDCNTSSVVVGFKNETGCFPGEIASATQKTTKTGGLISGSFMEAVGANFTGTVSPDGKTMNVTVQNVTCTLTYTVADIEEELEETPEEEEEANATTAAGGAAAAPPAAAEAPAPKSAAAGITSLPAVALALVGAVVAAIAL